MMTNTVRDPAHAKSRAAFLDRDGVINRDTGYVFRISDFEFLSGSIEGMRALQSLGYKLVVVTNQSGIGRGLYTENDFHRLSSYMLDCLAAEGVTLSGLYFCPHRPPGEDTGMPACECRKPAPGMIENAARDIDIDLGRSILIGDKQSDIDAGHAAGVGRCFMISNDSDAKPTTSAGAPTFPSLLAVAQHLASEPND